MTINNNLSYCFLDTISRKIFSYDIGPRIEHTFLIENQGWITLTNLSLILQLPYETTNGHRLLYLTDQIREASYTNQSKLIDYLHFIEDVIKQFIALYSMNRNKEVNILLIYRTFNNYVSGPQDLV